MMNLKELDLYAVKSNGIVNLYVVDNSPIRLGDFKLTSRMTIEKCLSCNNMFDRKIIATTNTCLKRVVGIERKEVTLPLFNDVMATRLFKSYHVGELPKKIKVGFLQINDKRKGIINTLIIDEYNQIYSTI